MSEHLSQKSPKKAKPTFTYAIFSMTIILFLVGVLGIGYFILNKSVNKIKESIEVEVELKDSISDADLEALKVFLTQNAAIKTVEFKSKQQAVESFQKGLGQDIIGIAGFNPLYDAFIIRLNAEYSNEQKFNALKASIISKSGVKYVNYSPVAMDVVGANINKVLAYVGGAIFILLLASLSLIDNTIRLLMFTQRFIIRSMQLIGATKWFIIKPYIIKGITAGLISALLSIAILSGMVYFFTHTYDELALSQPDYLILGLIALSIFIIGITISAGSTYLAVNKYLRLKLDELY